MAIFWWVESLDSGCEKEVTVCYSLLSGNLPPKAANLSPLALFVGQQDESV